MFSGFTLTLIPDSAARHNAVASIKESGLFTKPDLMIAPKAPQSTENKNGKLEI